MSTSAGLTTILDGSRAHVVDLLGPRPAGRVRQGIVLLQAFDELTGHPVRGRLTVTTDAYGLTGGTAADGVGGLVGTPSRAFPDLAGSARTLDVRVDVPGYLPWTGTVTLPAQPGFPDTFNGVALGRINLHRVPVTLEVHTFKLDAQGGTVAVGGADVNITGVWRTTADLTQPAAPPQLLAMPLGATQAWPLGTGIDSVSLVPVAEPPRLLAASTAPGDRTISVSRAGALAPGDLVGLDLADPDRRGYLTVQSLSATGDQDSPVQLTLAGPVRIAHAAGVGVRRVTAPAPAPADTTTTDPVSVGDPTVFVGTTAPFASVELVRAAGAGITDEYLDSHLYRATSTADGTARLPPISRVAAVEISAGHGGLTATVRVTPDYQTPVNTVGLTLR
ncbi:hypothetical protein [Flexivirga oryzae]|uniref:Uncharacterized protein n=1 Tax=Flexivirga oryzae TaxID=1794944 RepID=A0A839MXS0_9MICO|nr:hypothetical protein [Flexivirga oryzae]MBB2890240.1 hypothetical protein [Flexivirga oryzae]